MEDWSAHWWDYSTFKSSGLDGQVTNFMGMHAWLATMWIQHWLEPSSGVCVEPGPDRDKLDAAMRDRNFIPVWLDQQLVGPRGNDKEPCCLVKIFPSTTIWEHLRNVKSLVSLSVLAVEWPFCVCQSPTVATVNSWYASVRLMTTTMGSATQCCGPYFIMSPWTLIRGIT